jgi:hypothetical protein
VARLQDPGHRGIKLSRHHTWSCLVSGNASGIAPVAATRSERSEREERTLAAAALDFPSPRADGVRGRAVRTRHRARIKQERFAGR